MKTWQLTDFRSGDAWMAFRLDAQVQNQAVDIYMLMDLPSGKLMSFQAVDTDVAEDRHVQALLDSAFDVKGQWPKRIILAKADPAEDLLQKAAAVRDIRLECVPEPQLEDLIAPIKQSYGQRFFSPSSMPYAALDEDIDEMDRESVKQMIPETYDPCWCASGKKFKFCCKPIFKDIVGAMAFAEEGRKDEALRHIEEAKKIVGETPEVLCREAIVWSHFDKDKSTAILERALAANPSHPRANYLRGIDLMDAGNHHGAIAAYKRAIDCYPKTARYHLNEAYNNLGTAYFESGDPMKAKAAWEQALVLMPSDKTVRRNLIEFIYGNAQLSGAERAMSPFVEKFFDRVR